MTISDVLIIGAGPVGLFAIHQCGMLGQSVTVVDSLPEIGGQCSALYPEKPIYDIPSQPTIAAGDLIAQLEQQAAPFCPTYILGQSIETLERRDDLWNATTAQGTLIQARSIIIAGGAGAFGPHRPPLEHLENYEGKSVFYMVRQRELFRNKHIVIAGGGDSAVDWALSLCPIAKSLTLVHRRDKFKAAPESIRQLDMLVKMGRVTLHTPYQLKRLEGTQGQLSHVHIADFNGKEKCLEADVLLPFFGLASNLGPIADWGLDLDQAHIQIDPGTCATNLEGVYAIGDIATYPHKLKLILTGFAEAAQAAQAIRHYLHPEKNFHFEYSTTKGLPT